MLYFLLFRICSFTIFELAFLGNETGLKHEFEIEFKFKCRLNGKMKINLRLRDLLLH